MILLKGFPDSLNILAFKWRAVKPAKNKFWLLGGLVIALFILGVTAYSGTLLRTVINQALNNPGGGQESIILWLNIFLKENASLAMSGVFWALITSIVLIPLVGYSFASIIPEGDLASIRVTENHKITDSILLQFVSSISFVQILTLTALSSILTIGVDRPGLGIVVGWMLWVLSVFASVLSAWGFEYLHRKYGPKSKAVALSVLAVLIGGGLIFAFDHMVDFFGLAKAYTEYIQSLSFENINNFLAAGVIFAGVAVILLYGISLIGVNTLKIQERPRRKNKNQVLFARFGLVDKNRINSLTQFMINMIIRQSNIWKPLLLSIVFTTGMGVAFYGVYDILLSVSTLIPVMISLVWSINFFGILGSATMWLVSLPHVRRRLLQSVVNVQYFIIIGITLLIAGLLSIIHKPDFPTIATFFAATFTTSLVVTQYAIGTAVRSPHRYRVYIRGESVLPPNKALSHMVKLFAMGFALSGIMYGLGVAPYASLLGRGYTWVGTVAQLTVMFIVFVWTRIRFNRLQLEWLKNTEVLQRIVKTVGVAD